MGADRDMHVARQKELKKYTVVKSGSKVLVRRTEANKSNIVSQSSTVEMDR